MPDSKFHDWYSRQDIDYKEDCDPWSAKQGWFAAVDEVIKELEKPWSLANGISFIDRLRSMQSKVRLYND